MKYEKPIVRMLASAADVIQSSTIKNEQLVQETFAPFDMATLPAYEADE